MKEVNNAEEVKLITHNGTFHYDEILATAFLMEIFSNSTVVRTRDENIINSGDIVYDVGSVFDPSTYRFDHHQRTFNETYSSEYDVKLSSAGLIYKYFSELLFEKYGFPKSHYLYNDIKEKIYKEYVLYADAIDNGYDIFGKIIPRTMASLVGSFNDYNVSGNDAEKVSNDNFYKALEIVRIDLKNYLRKIFKDYVPKYEETYNELQEVTDEIYFTEKNISTETIFDVDKKLNKNIKFVIFPSNGMFRIYALPKMKESFECRVPLYEKWRGLRNEDLIKVSGIKGCTFVHASGFTGGNLTKEGAFEMCKVTLANTK